MPIDNVLKLYSETIKSPFLHYGFWRNPDKVDVESMTLKDVECAQLHYIEHLESFIPSGVKQILDVGCGLGGNIEYLRSKGYELDALSPDDYQRSEIYNKFNGDVPFYHCKFEKFMPEKQYDLIIESESVCYIKMNEGFKMARKALRNDGFLLASDYFIHFRDSSKSPLLKSSHGLSEYLSYAEKNGFTLVKEFDQTENTMITLDYAKYLIERFVFPTIDYGLFSAKRKYPKILKFIKKITMEKWIEKKNQLDLIDSSLFRKYRKYMIYLFQKKSNARYN